MSPVLTPAMPRRGPVEWAGARWVGEVDEAVLWDPQLGSRLELVDGTAYRAARLLVTRAGGVAGFVDLPVENGTVDTAALRDAVWRLPESGFADRSRLLPGEEPWITVVICTRDRVDQLREALDSVLACDYPAFDVVVVDNASASDALTRYVRDELRDARVSVVAERVPGLARARNRGLAAAQGAIVAFTDDDVVVHRDWLRRLAEEFVAPEVWCVSGLVPSGELRTPVQAYFDQRVSWSSLLRRREFLLAKPPADLPMFPFSVGEFGTGANFAVDRRRALELGGFDVDLGAGVATAGGEDLDFFTRVLVAGGGLTVTPSAIVWHRHRTDLPALRVQARGYGTGLGAWLAKLATDRRMRGMALARAPRALVRLLAKGGGSIAEDRAGQAPLDARMRREIRRVGWLELRSVLRGPVLFARLRRTHGGEAARLDPVPPRERRAWALVAVAAGAAALLSLWGVVPPPARLGLLLAGVGLGPGALVRAWIPLPSALTAMLVPATGLALALIGSSLMAQLALWQPALLTAILGGALLAAGAVVALLAQRAASRVGARGAEATGRAAA
ncbi:MAG: glycosyltransferase [Actinomycetales bacterium]|nr:glycosyltransferase [Actinomycetales bacterium]